MKQVQKVRYKDIETEDRRFFFKAPGTGGGTVEEWSSLPLLWREGRKWIPVLAGGLPSGGGTELTYAVTYPENIPYEEVLWDIVRIEKAAGRLNIFDIAHIIVLLEKHADPHCRDRWCRRMGIGGPQWKDYRRLQSYDTGWKQYFIQKHAPMKRALVFREAELRELFGPLLDGNPGINMLESAAVLLQEAARRDACGLAEYWEKAELDKLLRDKGLKPVERLREIRMHLYRERYPVIVEHRRRLQETLSSLQLPENLHIDADPLSERPGVILRADMEDREAVDRTAAWINGHRNALKTIMDIQEGKQKDEE
ncbi:MAG: hypothetical protein U5N26_00310 [Candidatus Marinimicrobia bacterium]|nr:hypothetical protein [Candidatus Neomarinimicrobiota bacterium]